MKDLRNPKIIAKRRQLISEKLDARPTLTVSEIVARLRPWFGADLSHAHKVARKIMLQAGWAPPKNTRKNPARRQLPTAAARPRMPAARSAKSAPRVTPARAGDRARREPGTVAPDWGGPSIALAGPLDRQVDMDAAAKRISRWEWRLTSVAFRVMATRIMGNEGFREFVYLCTADKPTIGYGINLAVPRSTEEVLAIARAQRERLSRLIGELSARTEPICLAPGGKLTNVGQMIGLDCGISEPTARNVLMQTLNQICDRVDADPVYAKLDATRRGVVVEMIYQLGWRGVEKFRKFRAALENQDYDEAAEEMKDSKWHQQTPGRCAMLAEIMRTAEPTVKVAD